MRHPCDRNQRADLIAERDGKKIIIQAKRYEGTVVQKLIKTYGATIAQACYRCLLYTQPYLLLSAFCFEDITHRAARNRFAFHGITSEEDFGF